MSTTSFFFIAGEPSGDVLGAALIRGLKSTGQPIDITGIGGDVMKKEGFETLLDMNELCVIGLWEILFQIKRLKGLINSLVEEIEERQPDILVTIDLPDFNFRLAKMLKQRGKFKGKIVHYVAPTVWAWRPGRAQKIAEFLDGLICLFPFEPEYFTKHGLNAVYAGHPLAEMGQDTLDPKWFEKVFDLKNPDVKKIGVFFGSRPSEVKSIAPVITEAIHALYERDPNISLIIPTLPNLELDITNIANDLPCEAFVLTGQEDKWKVFASCDMAVAVSGTVGLELAYLGVPHFITYKVHPLTWVLLKLLVKSKYAHLANIILDKKAVPELLQWDCTPFKVAQQFLDFMEKPEHIAEQKKDLTSIGDHLQGPNKEKPSERAAQFLLSFKGK